MRKGFAPECSLTHGPSLMAIKEPESVPFDELVALRQFQILAHHLAHELPKRCTRYPTQLQPGFGCIAEQCFDFGGTKIAWVDRDDALSGLNIVALFIEAVALPSDPDADFLGGKIDEVAHRMLLTCGNHEVLRFVLLQHQPLHLNIIPCMAPIALGTEIAEMNAFLKTKLDAGKRARNLSGNECLAAEWRFMVEQDSVACVHSVGFAIVDGAPIRVQLGDGVGRSRIKRCCLLLRRLLPQAVALTTCVLLQPHLSFPPHTPPAPRNP